MLSGWIYTILGSRGSLLAGVGVLDAAPASLGEHVVRLRTFKASDSDWERWRSLALREGISLSAWLRRACGERADLDELLLRQEGGDGCDDAEC